MKINVKQLTVGKMQTNCYLVWGETRESIIIDPGEDAEYIIQSILDLSLTPKAILATHGHFDHLMAVLELKLAFSIPFYIHKKDAFLLSRMRSSAKHFLDFDPGPAPKADFYLKEKSILQISNLQIETIGTPGHTPGSVSFYLHSRSADSIFVGDLLFSDASTGRTDFLYSDKNKLNKSICKILKFSPETTIYPGHGNQFQLKFIEYKNKNRQEKPR